MNTDAALAIANSLHDLNVKALWETNLSDLKAQLESMTHPSQRAKIHRAIADAEFRIKEIEYMETLSVGQWVGSDMAAKPGKITSLGYAGQVPQALVEWWGASVSIPERPLNLTVLSEDEMLYVWNHEKFPKLVRRFDNLECKDVEVLEEKLQEAAYYLADAKEDGDETRERDYQLQVTYCNKRIAYLTTPKNITIAIAKINRNGGTQQRINLNNETVIEYAEAMREGNKFPPVKLTYDGTNYWLTDGFHTTEAAWSIGQKDIDAIITSGSQRDAILASVGVNSDHGLRRSNADKRRAVTTLLKDEEWGKWSDREISRRCKVDHKTVGKIRQDLTGEFPSENPKKYRSEKTSPRLNEVTYQNKHGNISTMKIDKIGRKEMQPIPIEINQDLSVGQLVQINQIKDRPDKRLVGYKNAIALITAVNPASVDLKIWGTNFDAVSLNDLKFVDEDNLPAICISPSRYQYRMLIDTFESKEEMLKAAIAWRSRRRLFGTSRSEGSAFLYEASYRKRALN